MKYACLHDGAVSATQSQDVTYPCRYASGCPGVTVSHFTWGAFVCARSLFAYLALKYVAGMTAEPSHGARVHGVEGDPQLLIRQA
ncbi:hypothetical protein HaLaN_14391 [Haematococcus lacustris]|uniref:Uncharacterized protein n=1 Tax=Haematococcus lacustris TaxID=44745 RepID=A0A699ZFM5_HAELA|nr:hypothetical protein HaLaN_14391 [Haematococcus lacustris]